jgi:protein-S-isoprenylcysteine O-methyltransferase Ste14
MSPGLTLGLLAEIGMAVTSGNWVSVAVFVVAWTAIIAWRIHIEETALKTALGDKYGCYAAHHKRLIPLVW